MQHAQDLRPLFKPARDLQSSLMLVRQPHTHAAQPALRQVGVVGSNAQAELVLGIAQALPVVGVGRHRPEHDVGMATDIFGAGLDREVDAFLECAEIERRCPGIVHQHDRAAGMGGSGNRRDVLHFERQRARRLDEHCAGVGLDQCVDAAADQRIVVGGGDAVAFEQAVAELARRQIDAVGHQDVVAGLEHREQGERNCRKARRGERHARRIAVLQFPRSAFSSASVVGVPCRP